MVVKFLFLKLSTPPVPPSGKPRSTLLDCFYLMPAPAAVSLGLGLYCCYLPGKGDLGEAYQACKQNLNKRTNVQEHQRCKLDQGCVLQPFGIGTTANNAEVPQA